MRFRLLVMALLLFSLFVPAAGAIYIPGQEIPNDGQPHILLADSGSGVYPTPDTGGPIKRYLSDDPNDYVLVPGDDPDMMYALGETPVEPPTMAISAAPATISTNVPSYVDKPPAIPSMRAIAASTSAETVMPPDFNAPSSSSKFIPSISGLQHLNAASRGYDVSKIGNIVMPSMPARTETNTGMPEFKFPALFG